MEYLEKYDELLVLIDIFEEMKNNYDLIEYNLRQQNGDTVYVILLRALFQRN